MKDRPTMTICFDPNAKPSVLDQYGTNMLEFLSMRAKEPNVSIPYTELYHAVAYKVGIDFNITLKLHEEKYHLLIDNEDVPKENSQIIEFEAIYTLWKGLCYRITQKIKVVEDMMYSIVIHFNKAMPDEDLPKHVDVFFTSVNNPYGVISLKWLDGDELGFVLKPREMYYHYTDLEIRRYKFTNKQKSTGQRSCSNKSTIECTTFG